MRLGFTRWNWNRLAAQDPYWAVLTEPDRKENRWKLEEFFLSGRKEVEASLAEIRRQLPEWRTGTALDFGCGVGRLTQGLADHFDEVTGVDIAEAMLQLALRHNRHGSKVTYLHNTAPDLRLLPAHRYDLVYSLITLQHMDPSHARRYIREFVRVAKPSGAIYFQLPGSPQPPPAPRAFTLWPDTLIRRLVRDVRTYLAIDQPRMEMHHIPRGEVEALLRKAGAEVVSVLPSDAAGSAITSWTYLARKS